MELISAERRKELLYGVRSEAVHLEMRDNYRIDEAELAKWRAGEPPNLQITEGWCEHVREQVALGRRFRRACVVSEPLSEYQRWAYAVTGPQVEAGEDLRWVPRRRLSTVALPGNDFWMLDERSVTFGVFSGMDDRVEIQLFEEPEVIEFCRTVFEAVWSVAIPHREYRPA